MPPTVTLQSQYPLSPRKFWKKMIQKIVFGIVIFGILAVLIFVLTFLLFPSIMSSSSAAVVYPTVVTLLAIVGISFAYVSYIQAYIRRYYYDATDSYVTIKKGVFAPAEIHIQYSKIQDVYVDQDILDRIMGLYDVHLASATVASGIEAHIDGVDQAGAEGLKNFLLQKLQSGGSNTPNSGGVSPVAFPVAQNNQPAPVTFESEISSRTYPITGIWVVQQIISTFFFAVFAAIIVFVILIGSKNGSSSIAQEFGLGAGFLLTTFVAVLVVTYVLRIISSLLWRANYSFNFLPDYIVTKQGIIAKKENHLPYRAVQDVTVSQGIVERMLGIATVRIENAAAAQAAGRNVVSSAVLIPGQPLAQANEISDAIKRVALTKNSSQTGL